MTPKQFYDTVCKMRTAQREYVRTRSMHWFERSKEIESKIDAEITRVENLTKPKQGELPL